MRGLPAPRVHGNVRFDPAPQQCFDEARGEEALVAPERGGDKPSRRWACCSSAKQPAVSGATERKISGPNPSRMRCRFSMRALTVWPGKAPVPDVPFDTNRQSGSLSER